MIKSLRIHGMLLVFGLAGLSGLFAQGPKIGVVNIEGVIQLSDMGKALQAKIEGKMKEAQAEIKPQVEMARELQSQLQQNAATLSPTKLAELRRQLDDAKVDIQRKGKDAEADVARIRDEGLGKIEIALKPIFQDLRDKDGYDLILSGGSGAVLSVSESMDISKLVLERLNASSASK